MSKQPLIDFIKKNVPNIFVTNESLALIAENFEATEFSKGEYFLKQGKICNYLLLTEGLMRAYTFNTNGEDVTTYFYPRNRMVFDAACFFQKTYSTENIQALTDCKGYEITFDKLNMLFHSVPEFREFGREMLVREFIHYKKRTLAMINKSAEERYEDLINENHEIFKYAQLKHIASYLGIADTSLSRIRREFSKK